jgi:hypothetical protein
MLSNVLTGLLGFAVRQARKRVTWLWWPVAVALWIWRRVERRSSAQ